MTPQWFADSSCWFPPNAKYLVLQLANKPCDIMWFWIAAFLDGTLQPMRQWNKHELLVVKTSWNGRIFCGKDNMKWVSTPLISLLNLLVLWPGRSSRHLWDCAPSDGWCSRAPKKHTVLYRSGRVKQTCSYREFVCSQQPLQTSYIWINK